MAEPITLTAEELDAKIEEAKKPLIEKRDELLKSQKKLKEQMKQFEGIDLEKLQSAAAKLEEMEMDADKQNGEYKKLYDKLVATSTEQINSLKELVNKEKEHTNNFRKETELMAALTAQGVLPEMSGPAKKLLLSDIALTDDNIPMVGDKPVMDYVKEWATTDVGKRFFSNGNQGGDAIGPGKGLPAEAEFYNPKSPKFNKTEQARIANKDPKAHERYKKVFKA